MKFASKLLVTCMVAAFASSAIAAERYKPDNELIEPIKAAKVENQAEVDLGAKLYFDPRLSRSGFISCNSCHNLSMGGTDNLQTSIGDKWQQGPINAPTVLNSTLNFVQFWDGRAKDLKEQAGGPIANPGEMAFTHDLAVGLLNSIPQYVEEFKKVYGKEKIDIDQVTKAIATFEDTLVTPNSRFDQWLSGKEDAITDQELQGYLTFRDAGCVACHNGAAVGGSTFQKMGVVDVYVTDNASAGRAGVTGQDIDRMMFKVPTLRNVELTYPYFHDGAANTLKQAVETMGRLQLGKKFTDEENANIVAFLKTLTGDQPDLKLPIIPPSSDATPRPNPWAEMAKAEDKKEDAKPMVAPQGDDRKETMPVEKPKMEEKKVEAPKA
ncbi:Di-haem cytochrome c peroxidase [Taylorella equigenitalis 14/56]|uniref:Di-haem cytochrome c peroxidase n=1 Tax=Taylorella equigenitalis 14/56 TaxID=1091497 RepID=I7JJ22_9BURK|nr:cytochrome-c peroxidase [Taylorella equigenitalis]CCG17653.1 Di-haem cytochrome c peroxidase [Taylorella equigenitalis 14/56]